MANKKKIGIVTYWQLCDNYGQQLQMWALQRVLKQMGHAPFLIRYLYWQQPLGECSTIKKIKRLIKREIKRCWNVPNLKEIIRRHFPLFRFLHIDKTSCVYYSYDSLRKNAPKADVYLAGSDQVWNLDSQDDDLKVSFLQFGDRNTKRISYAPSIGYSVLSKEREPMIKEYLSTFQALSIREFSAQSTFEKMEFKPQVVLDPTMLICAEDYKSIMSLRPCKSSIYIYSLNYGTIGDLPFEEIRSYSVDKHLPIVVTPGSGHIPARELFSDVTYSYASIGGWLKNIQSAELVITASFHGIVFSILMHTPFLFTPLEGSHEKSNQRIYDLLHLLNLEDRIWKRGESIASNLSNDPNWDAVDEKMQSLRSDSIEYLKSAIEK